MAFYLELNQPRSRRPPPPLTPPPPSYPTGPPPPVVRPQLSTGTEDVEELSQPQTPHNSAKPRQRQAFFDDGLGEPGEEWDEGPQQNPPVRSQPLSSAIESYIGWMTCHGIDVPKMDDAVSLPSVAAERFNCNESTFTKKKHPKGILHAPKVETPRSLGKSVRWRDHQVNSKTVCCTPCFGGDSALVDVYDESKSKVPLQRTPTPMDPRFMDDPILSFREQNLSSDSNRPKQPRRPSSPHPQKRPSSPHPQKMRPLSMRRAPSPHPRKLGKVFPEGETTPTAKSPRLRVQPPAILTRRRDRSASPLPKGSRTSESTGSSGIANRPPTPRRESTTERESGIANRPPTPRRGGETQPSHRPSTPRRRVGIPLSFSRSSSQTRDKEPRQPPPGEPKRHSELPNREEPRYPEERRERPRSEQPSTQVKKPIPGDLPVPREDKHYAEIVWKSKEPSPPKEEKKRGWKLVKRSSSRSGSTQRSSQGPQPEKPLLQRRGMQRGRPPVTIVTNTSSQEEYDRYR